MVTGIVMASGLSRRFGSNKLLTPIGDAPLFVHTLNAAMDSLLNQVIVVTQYPEIIDYCSKREITTIFNPHPEKGQSQSVILGVTAASSRSHYLFLTADQPNITAEFINRLLEKSSNHPLSIIIPMVEGVPSSPVLFPPSTRGELLELTGDKGGRPVINNHPELLVPFAETDVSLLKDIDTLKDIGKIMKKK